MEVINPQQDEKKYRRARKQVKELRGFYSHFISFVIVNAFLLMVNLVTSPSHLWFFWPLLGWGVGLSFHAYGVFGKNVFFSKDWEERKIKEIMEKDDGRG